MPQVGLLTPLRNDTLKKLQLNAGILIKNLKIVAGADGAPVNATALRTLIAAIIAGTDQTDSGTILGATRGGGTFTVTRDMRTPDIDGMRYRFKGGNFVDAVDAYISTTLVEMTQDNLIDILGATVDSASSATYKQFLQQPTVIPVAAYLGNVAWVGEISDGSLICIVLKNAINTADFNLTFADKNEGTLAVEFHACQEQVTDYDYAPYNIIYLTDPQVQPNNG